MVGVSFGLVVRKIINNEVEQELEKREKNETGRV